MTSNAWCHFKTCNATTYTILYTSAQVEGTSIEGTSIQGTSIQGTSTEGLVQLWFRLAWLLQLIVQSLTKATACALVALAARLLQPVNVLLELNLHPFARRLLTANCSCDLTAFFFPNILTTLTTFCSGLIQIHSFIWNVAAIHWNRLTCCDLILSAGRRFATNFLLLQCGWQCIAVCRVLSDVWSAVSAWHAAALPLLPWTCTRIVMLALVTFCKHMHGIRTHMHHNTRWQLCEAMEWQKYKAWS